MLFYNASHAHGDVTSQMNVEVPQTWGFSHTELSFLAVQGSATLCERLTHSAKGRSNII